MRNILKLMIANYRLQKPMNVYWCSKSYSSFLTVRLIPFCEIFPDIFSIASLPIICLKDQTSNERKQSQRQQIFFPDVNKLQSKNFGNVLQIRDQCLSRDTRLSQVIVDAHCVKIDVCYSVCQIEPFFCRIQS